MLEYYSRGTGYRELAEFTAGFVAEAAERVLGSTRIEYGGKQIDLSAYEFVTVDDAFRLHAGCTASEADALDRFDELMVTKIEPELGNGKLTFLCDYPANRASLARLRADGAYDACPEWVRQFYRLRLSCCGLAADGPA